MQAISTLFGTEIIPQKRTSERAEAVRPFVEEINKERIESRMKPLDTRVIAIKLAHISIEDLYYFYSVCKDYKNRNGSFGKCFWGSLKVRGVDKS